MSEQFDVGSWGLFCGYDGKQIVLIDDRPCGPSSARKSMHRIPRELLLDEGRITQVYRTGVAIAEVADHAGSEWDIVLRPMFSPRSSNVMGVLAAVSPSGKELPDPPLIGSWEWEIELGEDRQPTPNRRTYWDRNLYEIYAVDPGVDQQLQGFWETGEWANELIDNSDQMRVNSLVRDGIQEGLNGVGKMSDTGIIRCLTYSVVTGYGSESRGRKHLRLVGQIVPVEASDSKIIIYGFSYEVPDSFHDMTFVRDANAGRVDDVLRGVMSLVQEPMAVVDADTLDMLMTSKSWRQEGFGHAGGLGEIAPDDSDELHDFIRAAAGDTENRTSMMATLCRTDGTDQRVRMTVTGVRAGVQGCDAVIRLDL